MELDTENLTDKQFWLAGWCAVKGHPRILIGAGEARVAANLERLGWGTVEDGASVERIFRLNQAGEDAFAWLHAVRAIPNDFSPEANGSCLDTSAGPDGEPDGPARVVSPFHSQTTTGEGQPKS